MRRSNQRGHFNHGWLDTYHTFSFGDYHDPNYHRFHSLRVLNDDIVTPQNGFGMHPHRDMEIISYVVSGELEHRDSLGNTGVLRAGDFQVMTAGSGILHAERNSSAQEDLRIIQTWILPDTRGLTPHYQDRNQNGGTTEPGTSVIASNRDEPGALPIHQDARVLHVRLGAGDSEVFAIGAQRALWVQVVDGTIQVGNELLERGDGVGIENETSVEISANTPADLLVFDLATRS
ncbi:MAG: pirin family protein [Phycisphaerae bacterium]